MKNILAVIVVAFGLCSFTFCQAAEGDDTAKTWGDAIHTVPCAAFQKNSNGSWTVAKIVLGNGARPLANNEFGVGAAISPILTDATISNATLEGSSDEAQVLNARCGQPQ